MKMSSVEVELHADQKLLAVRFSQPQRMLSWAIWRGGFVTANAVAWVFVRNEELTPDVDPQRLIGDRLQMRGLPQAVGLLTSRYLQHYVDHEEWADALTVRAVTTIGLSNALRAGDPAFVGPAAGTINLLVSVSQSLSPAATVEVLSLATEARTAALLDLPIRSCVSGLAATGTGTDCTVVASPAADEAPTLAYGGKHTRLGELVARAVYTATHRGALAWLEAAKDGHRQRRAPSTS